MGALPKEDLGLPDSVDPADSIAIEEFPKFSEIRLDEKPLFDRLFSQCPPDISEFTFTNFFAWKHAYDFKITKFNRNYLVKGNFGKETHFLEPLIPLEDSEIVFNLLEYYRNAGKPVSFIRASQRTADILKADKRLLVTENRDNFDYVYSRETLGTLSGRKFDGKRNFIKRALHHDFEVRRITPELIEPCRKLLEKWRLDKLSARHSHFDMLDFDASSTILDSFDQLNVFGITIMIDGEVEAFTVAEQLNPITIVTHIEKANRQLKGLYQLINFIFCRDHLQSYQYINREQDLGIPGLRKAKLSYYPQFFIEKFKIELKP